MAVAFDTSADGYSIVYKNDSSSNTTITGTKPANVADGDVLIAIVGGRNAANPFSFTAPAGWTQIYTPSYTNGTFTAAMKAWYKVASGEPSTYEWTISESVDDDFIAIHRITGADTSTVLSGTPTEAPQDVTSSPIGPSVTTADDGALAVFIVAMRTASIASDDSGYPTGTTGFYARDTRPFSGGMTHGLAYKTITPAGATGAQTWTGLMSSSTYGACASFAIKPGSGSTASPKASFYKMLRAN